MSTTVTMPVVWRCPHCPQPVTLTCTVTSTPDGYRVAAGHHITVHLKQHDRD